MTKSNAEKTLRLTVADVGSFDRLGEDCYPLQFLRELTQNSIEAIGLARPIRRVRSSGMLTGPPTS